MRFWCCLGPRKGGKTEEASDSWPGTILHTPSWKLLGNSGYISRCACGAGSGRCVSGRAFAGERLRVGTASPITKNFLTQNVNNIKIEKFLHKNKISQRRQEQPGRINRVFIDSEEACGLLFQKRGKAIGT